MTASMRGHEAHGARLPSLAGAAWLQDPALQRVLGMLTATGGAARIAGGAVRNELMGEAVADIDIATTLPPARVIAAAAAAGLGVHPIGLAHGTVLLTIAGTPFEVTTLRVDVETDGRWAKVAFTDNWAADASRRDFTMNALYCDAEGNLYDYTGGYPDILKRKVRFVGSPAARVREDFLRILRFFRFHARYGRGAPDALGLKACVRLKSGLLKLSAERIRQELFKLLVAPRAAETLSVMAKHGILKLLIPDLGSLSAVRRMARIDAAESFEPDSLLRLATLSQDPLALRAALRLTNAEVKRLDALAQAPPVTPALRARERRAMLYHLGEQAWRDAGRLAWARARGRADDEAWRGLVEFPRGWRPPRFPVSGGDLGRRGLPSGPEIGRLLRKLEDWWIACDFQPTRQDVLDHLPRL